MPGRSKALNLQTGFGGMFNDLQIADKLNLKCKNNPDDSNHPGCFLHIAIIV
ncbi:hypothetical protein GGR35_002105 [Mucilaginibacter phyllosphaerae]|uniref:Uncharacterized protein n=1 Tax=Mucilaginibacter phyllosphaerae TaxID=1812349 RepID=A0ABR6I962_9SPHI|nr:hypothetical protein [Mucilaginibacter phyllosphaerae]